MAPTSSIKEELTHEKLPANRHANSVLLVFGIENVRGSCCVLSWCAPRCCVPRWCVPSCGAPNCCVPSSCVMSCSVTSWCVLRLLF